MVYIFKRSVKFSLDIQLGFHTTRIYLFNSGTPLGCYFDFVYDFNWSFCCWNLQFVLLKKILLDQNICTQNFQFVVHHIRSYITKNHSCKPMFLNIQLIIQHMKFIFETKETKQKNTFWKVIHTWRWGNYAWNLAYTKHNKH